jgi:hypothetical protein
MTRPVRKVYFDADEQQRIEDEISQARNSDFDFNYARKAWIACFCFCVAFWIAVGAIVWGVM